MKRMPRCLNSSSAASKWAVLRAKRSRWGIRASGRSAIPAAAASYIQAALDQLTREGWDISQLDIARVSPLAFKHINFLGRYAFDLPAPSARSVTLIPNGLSHSLMSVHRPAQTHGPTWRRYIDTESLRDATRRVVNATLAVRDPRIWGDGTTACASDSKHFGAFDQNLMTEWHIRYGGRGVMIYWHVERGSVCIHSRLRRCSSSEVAAMIEGVLRHDTEMEVERQYVDSHGQSEVAFAFCRMLGFHLLPRLKAISAQRLYLPDAGGVAAYPNLARILARQLTGRWSEQQYDEFVRYTTAMAERTAGRRFEGLWR